MKLNFSFKGTVQKFPGLGGWYYVVVPKKYTRELQEQRKAWGMYPIKAHVGNTSWKTKLMMKKGGRFFIALNKEVRKKEHIVKNKKIKAKFDLI